MMEIVNVNTPSPYNLYIGEGVLLSDSILAEINKGKAYSQMVIISDDNVAPLYAEQLQTFLRNHFPATIVSVISVPAGEASKCRQVKAEIEDQLLAMHCRRDTCLIALGGGVITDLVGYVAATYMRGVDVIYIATSLLAMVDASIGGKTGINTRHGKNLLGTFTQPKAVFIDVATLDTLPIDEYRFAFAEVIKHALLSDNDYLQLLLSNTNKILQRDKTLLSEIIYKSCQVKADIVVADEKESGLRANLNLGHTVAHAIENQSDYVIPHGLAVAYGLLIEAEYGLSQGIGSVDVVEQLKYFFRELEFDLSTSQHYSMSDLLPLMLMDKKNDADSVTLILLEEVGRAVKYQIEC